MVEVSSRTLLGMYLLRPSREANERILGILGRAQRLFPVELFAFTFLSNHFHWLMRVLSSKRMADFTGYVKSNVAKELGELYDWKAKFWGGRYYSASVPDSEAGQRERFEYILSNGCKENLVASPLKWPGVSSAPALYRGETTLTGRWYDRTAEYHAKLRGRHELFPTTETVRLSPLPFLEKLTSQQRQAFMVDAVRRLEESTAARHDKEKSRALGARKILQRDPHDTPDDFRPSRAKPFLASSLEEYLAMKQVRDSILAAYRDASERLRRGEKNVEFPENTFPPAGPFVDPRGPPL